jgi:hypothetical protein
VNFIKSFAQGACALLGVVLIGVGTVEEVEHDMEHNKPTTVQVEPAKSSESPDIKMITIGAGMLGGVAGITARSKKKSKKGTGADES